MKELSTNVLVIGKSGTGKSSLLNYLFDREIQKTGTGKPVTEEGIFPFDYEYDTNFKIRIYDTWGLEPDKADKWRKLIMDEVEKHENANVHEWFNTIIFCVSANSSRTEDFEKKIINSLLEDKNHIVVAITHCDSSNDKNASIIKKELLEKTMLSDEDIIFVNNVEKKLIGKSVCRFGKERIFVSIIRNLWKTFKSKVPYRVNQILCEEFELEKENLHNLVASQRLLFRREKRLDKFEEQVNLEFQEFVSKTMDGINKKFEEAMDYYNALSKQYSNIGELLNKEEFKKNPNLRFDAFEDFEKEVEDAVSEIRKKIGEISQLMHDAVSKEVLVKLGIAIKKYFSSSKTIKKELYEAIDNYLKKAQYYMELQIAEIEKRIQEKDIENIYDNQIKLIQVQE